MDDENSPTRTKVLRMDEDGIDTMTSMASHAYALGSRDRELGVTVRDDRPAKPRRTRRPLAIAVTLLLCVGCQGFVSSNEDPETAAIIGGTEEALSIANTTGALYARTEDGVRFICSGVLIAPDLVLTAAHCVAKTLQSELLFSLQSTLRERELEDASLVSRRAVHEQFRWVAPAGEPLNDIALVQLAAPRQEIPALIGVDPLAPGTLLALIGYGDTSLALDAAVAGHQARNVGVARVSTASDHELTIDGGIQACRGDSGGPALLLERGVQRKKVVGITSRALVPSEPCVGGSIYTRVAVYAEWISQVSERWRYEASLRTGIDGGVNLPSSNDASTDGARIEHES